jgi:hypothetical protein
MTTLVMWVIEAIHNFKTPWIHLIMHVCLGIYIVLNTQGGIFDKSNDIDVYFFIYYEYIY